MYKKIQAYSNVINDEITELFKSWICLIITSLAQH